MSSITLLEANPESRISIRASSLGTAEFCFLVILITLAGITVDQLAAPVLYTSSPLWGAVTCLLLVWRRGERRFDPETISRRWNLSPSRILLFSTAHLTLILVARSLQDMLQPVAGSMTLAGWFVAVIKLSVLLPTALLVPFAEWRTLTRTYAAEGIAALIVLFTYFPGRALAALWPWYGHVLGKSVFLLSSFLVPALTLHNSLNPVLSGPDLDLTILFGCSGINGLELFDSLFALVVFLDWNRLRKVRTLFAYFLGIAAMLVGNTLRITFLFVLGNHGFAAAVARTHIAAGWAFFSVVFLVFLSVCYGRMLNGPIAP